MANSLHYHFYDPTVGVTRGRNNASGVLGRNRDAAVRYEVFLNSEWRSAGVEPCSFSAQTRALSDLAESGHDGRRRNVHILDRLEVQQHFASLAGRCLNPITVAMKFTLWVRVEH